jgi:hypothetical protein
VPSEDERSTRQERMQSLQSNSILWLFPGLSDSDDQTEWKFSWPGGSGFCVVEGSNGTVRGGNQWDGSRPSKERKEHAFSPARSSCREVPSIFQVPSNEDVSPRQSPDLVEEVAFLSHPLLSAMCRATRQGPRFNAHLVVLHIQVWTTRSRTCRDPSLQSTAGCEVLWRRGTVLEIPCSSGATTQFFPLPGPESPSFRCHHNPHGLRPRPFEARHAEVPAHPSGDPTPSLLASYRHISTRVRPRHPSVRSRNQSLESSQVVT